MNDFVSPATFSRLIVACGNRYVNMRESSNVAFSMTNMPASTLIALGHHPNLRRGAGQEEYGTQQRASQQMGRPSRVPP
jgi:hypothetical protein